MSQLEPHEDPPESDVADQQTAGSPPAPVSTSADAASVPDPASVSTAAPPPEPRPARRRGLIVVATVLAAALLLGVGIGIGYGIAPDDDETRPVASQPAVRQEPISAATEPVAAVAEALAPSVVQLEGELALGSGVIYDSAGYILTAAHVVADQSELTVRLSSGRTFDGEVLGSDDNTDIAVIKVDGKNLPAAPLAVGEEQRVGQIAVAIGSPFGLEQTVTSGIISAVHRAVPGPTDSGQSTTRDMIQTDAPINPGNSGGALADRQGRVIGINDAIQTTSQGNQGVGFAVPIDIAAWVADKIVAGEDPVPAFLGIVGTTPAGGRAGALITEVRDDTPAADADLQKGDLVVSFDGDPIQSMADLAARVRSLQPGTTVNLTVSRQDKGEFEVEVELTELPELPSNP